MTAAALQPQVTVSQTLKSLTGTEQVAKLAGRIVGDKYLLPLTLT